jgi:hypothetical protein
MDKYTSVSKLRKCSYILDPLIDRFGIDVNEIKPSTSKAPPSELLERIIRIAQVRE